MPEYLVEGLVRFSDLADDWWEVDSEAGCVIGQRTGQRLKIGDTVRVTIAAIDLADRKLDLTLAEDSPHAKQRAKKSRPTARKRRTTRRPKNKAPTKRRRTKR